MVLSRAAALRALIRAACRRRQKPEVSSVIWGERRVTPCLLVASEKGERRTFHGSSCGLQREKPSESESLKAVSSGRAQVAGRFGKYQEVYDESLGNPEQFWLNAAEGLDWFRSPSTALSQEAEWLYRWFPDGMVNTCYNCLDRHVKDGRGDQAALIYDSPLLDRKETWSYRRLLHQVSKFAAVLQGDEFQVQVGDRVVIYMPMIPEAVVAMLACARIGAIHSVVFGGFAAKELASRIDDCQPKVVLSASAGLDAAGKAVPYHPLLEEALRLAEHRVERCIIVQRDDVTRAELRHCRDVDYVDAMASSDAQCEATPLPSTHPHYVLYTSGTTGRPKGVLRDTGSYAVALQWSMTNFYGTSTGDVFWAASDIGWVVGHSYIVYAPLLRGCTTILYEGKPVKTPDAGAFWRIIQEYGVHALFAAPTAFRAIRQADPAASLASRYDLSTLQTLFVAGERMDPDTLCWLENSVLPHSHSGDNIPVVDHWWQTELGWPGMGNAVGLGHIPVRHGACAAPVPGYHLQILDDDGTLLLPNQLGNMVLQLPLPPGTLPTLYNDNDRFVQEYLSRFPGYYDTGDAAYIDEDGYVHIMGRTDDVINTSGVRLSTGALEELLLEHPEVAECAVIGVADPLRGQVPVGFVTTVSDSQTSPNDLQTELVQTVRKGLGPVANFKKVAVVDQLPKTRSGKILRSTMMKIANGQDYTITPTIEDATIFETLEPQIVNLVRPKTTT